MIFLVFYSTIFHILSTIRKLFKIHQKIGLSVHLYMNCTDVRIQMNFLTEASIANPTAEGPLFMVNSPHMLVHRALVGSAVVTERAHKRLVQIMNIFDVSFKVDLLGKV